jgi:hypothetical protein
MNQSMAVYQNLTQIKIQVEVVEPKHLLLGYTFDVFGSIADLATKSITEVVEEQLDQIIIPVPAFTLLSMEAISYYEF